jgi:hypothetical protein
MTHGGLKGFRSLEPPVHLSVSQFMRAPVRASAFTHELCNPKVYSCTEQSFRHKFAEWRDFQRYCVVLSRSSITASKFLFPSHPLLAFGGLAPKPSQKGGD